MQIRSGKRATPLVLDEVDQGIIEILRGNGRATNQEIADRLSITAATSRGQTTRPSSSSAL